jgi:acetylornithine deacetylase/succinyl-diaminopimelate desuccinylase-like protein
MTDATNTAIQRAVEYAHANYDTFMEGFKELLRIPSVSTDPAYREEMQRTADWLVAEMERIGLKRCQAIPSAGHPVVYGEWLEAGEDKPTVLIYAHYDVQPVDPIELWETPPFEPDVRDNRLYARGVIDDKCGVWFNLKALESMLESAGTLPVNVKICFEGEEETGSPNVVAVVKEHRELFAADLMLVSDGGSRPEMPIYISAARGVIDGEVVVTGPWHDVHSGLHGGIVHNPVHMVGKIIGAFHDDEGRIQIPGFYDDVRPLSPAAYEAMNAQEEETRSALMEDARVKNFWGVPEYTFMERATAQPTLDVTGVYGGYQGEGMKTIIPARAGFKATMRLVVDQDPDETAQKFVDFVKGFATDTLDIEVTVRSASAAVQMLDEGPAVEAIHRAFEATWGKRARILRSGGSIPILGTFQRELGIPMANLGFGVGENGHAPNEFYMLEFVQLYLDTGIHFYYYLAELMQDDGEAVAREES